MTSTVTTRTVDTIDRTHSPRIAYLLAGVLVVATLTGLRLLGLDTSSLTKPLALVLVAVAVASELAAARYSTFAVQAGWDWCAMLALYFVGSAAGVLVAWAAVALGWLVLRYRPGSLLINLASVGPNAVLARILFDALRDPIGFTAAVSVATIAYIAIQLVIVLPLLGLQDGVPLREMLRRQRTVVGPMVFQALFVITLTGFYRASGTAAVAVAVVFGGVFAYMVQLVVTARASATAQANLSWGVLSGLIRTLDIRDPRSARHCAAVAQFSRDIARAAGLPKTDQDLAHTAGLLHDIGKFALSDRVLDGDGLTEGDWRGIRRHPAIGADLLKDISIYGPVGEIVGAHHERWDGRGYPNKLAGEDIPLIARVVAVAEVYDTLTAPDTYRTPKTSFEALTVMREAAGRQFDPQFVEALATVLSGTDMSYRHAGDADFDRELDIQRRMSEAAG